MMRLRRFYVRKFRSVNDSGWIDCDSIGTLIGINEAGKSNLLLALWKLSPAREGEIDLLADLPRELYSTLRDAKVKPDFIEAEFELDKEQAKQLEDLTGCPLEEVSTVTVKRNYDGQYKVNFPGAKASTNLPADEVREVLKTTLSDLDGLEEMGKGEEGIKEAAKSAVQSALKLVPDDIAGKTQLKDVRAKLSGIKSSLKTSRIAPRVKEALKQITELQERVDRPHPDENEKAKGFILKELPSFVYYSTYGNLDSEIYLPHVIDNLQRTDLTGRTAAQTRTLRVLFNFVGLDPQEILEKGKEPTGTRDQYGQVVTPPTEEEIARTAKDKQERDVLLDSASIRLTREFRKWWQGNYVFDLAADGNHFRIWVSDEERPAKIELENRSTGLQWFLSFFLVFLVESEEAHKGALLLLDEAGLSLHALAQKDLINFFERLSETNQLIHTTHSPFLVNTDHVDRVKVVYVDDDGYTVASSDLRAGEKDPRQSKSIYAVHAALGLSVSEAMLQGCHLVIVEGQSDQYYLSAIKIYLISQGLLTPQREIVFAPAGGVRGVTSVAAIMASKADELPFVLLDSDKSGQDFRKRLLSDQYKGIEDRIVEVKDVLELENAEVEDLIPFALMRPALSRLFRDVEDEYFEDVYDRTQAVVPQIEAFAAKHGVNLGLGWKVDLARQVKGRLLQQGEKAADKTTVEVWKALFEKIYPIDHS